MANRDILAVGTSAGGVEALIHVAKGLPPNLPASVLLTIHLPSHARSALDDVLTRAGPLPASFAEEGEVVRKSRIYIAPPDRHLLLDGDRSAKDRGKTTRVLPWTRCCARRRCAAGRAQSASF